MKVTPKILTDRNIVPKREDDIQRAVLDVLRYVFPDTIPNPHIAQVTKTYKPDFGIRSLKALVEFKFATSKAQAMENMGGVYGDMKGYAGSEDWSHCYSVFYMTDHFIGQEQIDAEWKTTAKNENWTPIVVFGKGERKLPKTKA